MKDTKRKHLNNIKNLREENTQLKIDKEVARRQLISIRNQISDILGDKVIKMPDGADEKEQMKHFLQTYYKGLGELKEIEELHYGQADKKARAVASDIKEKVEPKPQNQTTQTQPNLAKEEETPKPAKCHNCQTLGIYKKGFCFKCLNEGFAEKSAEAGNIKAVEVLHDEQTFKCSDCGTSGNDEGSFKSRNGKMLCLDCLGEKVGWKEKKK